jgi:CheY-like chemotaxis protein
MDDSPKIDWGRPKYTIRRPLLGITILLVEDSRYCSETMRLLSIRSGARLRRADCLKSARRHLRIYRPDVVVVDLGLPDGCGVDLIREMSLAPSPLPAIIATSGTINGAYKDALTAGATYFMEKPIADLANFQQTILAALPAEKKPLGFEPRLAGICVKPDVQALKDDLDHIDVLLDDCLSNNDAALISYVAQFLNSLARDTDSGRLLKLSEKLRLLTGSDVFSSDRVRQEFRTIKTGVATRVAKTAQAYS